MNPNTKLYQEMLHCWRDLARIAAGIVPTEIPLEPTPAEVLRMKDDLEVLIGKVDRVVSATAEYVELATGYSIEHHCKIDQLLKALDGNLLYEIDCAAAKIRDDLIAAVA